MVIDYVNDIYQTILEAIEKKQLKDAIDELAKKTPAPTNTILTKQSREEAIEKRKKSDTMQLVDIPPTNPGGCVKV